MVIKGAQPYLREHMWFAHYPSFEVLYQAGICTVNEKASQPKNSYQEPTQPNQNTRPAKMTLNVKATKNKKYSSFHMPLSKIF